MRFTPRYKGGRSQYDTLREMRDDKEEIWYVAKTKKITNLPPDQWPEEWKEQQ